MNTKTVTITITIAVVLVLTIFCGVVYYGLYYRHVTANVVSVSPDGMYKCEVTERSNSVQSGGEVILYQRTSSLGSMSVADWKEVDKVDIHNDSGSRSNYSINWTYDERHRSTGVVVFGDFGSAPYEGEVVFKKTLAPTSR